MPPSATSRWSTTGRTNEINRPILGKELGTDEGTVYRNKFFAMIDRTNLTIDPSNAAAPAQGAPPVYFTYEPDVLLPNGVGPGSYNVVPDPDLVPPPGATALDNPSPTQVTCRIPAVSQTFGTQPPYPANRTIRLDGYYDGTQWSIVDDPANNNAPRTFAVLDAGPPVPPSASYPNGLPYGIKGELVQILFPPGPNQPALDAYGAATIILKPVNPTGAFLYRHARGAPIRLLTTDPTALPASTPGNPGPQAGFNYHTGRYAPVVRYAEQLR